MPKKGQEETSVDENKKIKKIEYTTAFPNVK